MNIDKLLATSIENFIAKIDCYNEEDIKFILKYTDQVTLFANLPYEWFNYAIDNNIYLLYNSTKLFEFLKKVTHCDKDIYNRFFYILTNKSYNYYKTEFYDVIVHYISLQPSKEEIKFVADKFFGDTSGNYWGENLDNFIDDNVDKLANDIIEYSNEWNIIYPLNYLDDLIGIRLTRDAVLTLCDELQGVKSKSLNLIRFFNCKSTRDFIKISKAFYLNEYLEREFLGQIIDKLEKRHLLDLKDYIQHENLYKNLQMTLALKEFA